MEPTALHSLIRGTYNVRLFAYLRFYRIGSLPFSRKRTSWRRQVDEDRISAVERLWLWFASTIMGFCIFLLNFVVHRRFNVYTGYGPVTIHSDHQPLTWLKRSNTANPRLLRWDLSLAEYDLSVEHVKGIDNHMADMLSRLFPQP